MAEMDLHWKRDSSTGVERMPDLVSEFLDWLLSDPRVPSSQKKWAVEKGLHEDTPRRWKKDPRFVKEWERRAAEKNISIDRVQQVVDRLFQNAIVSDKSADQLAYLQYVDRFTPKQVIVREGVDTEAMSDEELAAELEGTLPRLRAVD